jgi:hypothetical protein
VHAQGYKKEKEREIMNLKDVLAFRDFIGDIKGFITRRAWEGVAGTGTEPSPLEEEDKAGREDSTPSPQRIATRPSLPQRTSKQVELIESVLEDLLDESSHSTHSLV